jgi:hypothetical protein
MAHDPLPLLAVRLSLQVFRICHEEGSARPRPEGRYESSLEIPLVPGLLKHVFSPLPRDWRVAHVFHSQPYVGPTIAAGCMVHFCSRPTLHAVVFRGTIYAAELPHNIHPAMVSFSSLTEALSARHRTSVDGNDPLQKQQEELHGFEELQSQMGQEPPTEQERNTPTQPIAANGSSAPIPSVGVLKGYHDLFATVEAEVLTCLEALSRDTTHDVLFCGHSLGGALALLSATAAIRFPHVRCHLVVFGAGRIVTLGASTLLAAHLATSLAYERATDPVPRLVGRSGGGVTVGTRVTLPSYGWPGWLYPLAHDMIHYHYAVAQAERCPYQPEIRWGGPAWLTRYISPPH